MNNDNLISYDQSIMGEMHAWQNLEKSFRAVCQGDEKTFNSREYQKMKLAEYDRIWNTYQGRARTRDEKAWLTITLIRRRNLEQELYPNLIVRMMRRILNNLMPALDIRQELAMARQQNFGNDHFMSGYMDNGMGQTKEFKSDINDQRQQWSADLGKKQEQQQNKGLHL